MVVRYTFGFAILAAEVCSGWGTEMETFDVDSRLEVDHSGSGVDGVERRAHCEGMGRTLGDRHLVEIEDESVVVGNWQDTSVGTAEYSDLGPAFVQLTLGYEPEMAMPDSGKILDVGNMVAGIQVGSSLDRERETVRFVLVADSLEVLVTGSENAEFVPNYEPESDSVVVGFELGTDFAAAVHASGTYGVIGDAKLKFGVIKIPVDNIVKRLGTILDCLGVGFKRRQKLPFNIALVLR